MSGSYFVAQTSRFTLIDATDVTLGQGHGKVIQYIFPDPHILCSKYVRLSWNGLDVRGKSCCGGGRGGGGRGGNELKTWSHPRPGWLNYIPGKGAWTEPEPLEPEPSEPLAPNPRDQLFGFENSPVWVWKYAYA